MSTPLPFVLGACVFLLACGRPTEATHPADAESPPAPEAAASSPAANPSPISSASLAAFLNPSGLPAYDGPTGSVEGTITITGDAPPDVPNLDFTKCPAGRDTYGKLFREGGKDASGARPLADALVAITGYFGFYVRERADARTVTIENCAFRTRTIDMTIGQRLEIVNKTSVLFAPALAQVAMPALMVAPPNANGDPVRLYPLKPGYYTLVDRLGADYLKADVYALSYPLHTVTELSGRYRIDGVPVGTVQVNARSPAIQKETTKSVDIRAGIVAKVDLQLAYAAKSATAPRPSAKASAGAPTPTFLQ